MPDSFAQTPDVEARWRPLTSAETTVAETLLDDASGMVRARWSDVDARIAAGTLDVAGVIRVVAHMVKRAMIVGPVEGVEQQSQTAGPFGLTQKFTNPNANLYFTAEDVRLFDGKPARRAFGVDLASPSTLNDYYC